MTFTSNLTAADLNAREKAIQDALNQPETVQSAVSSLPSTKCGLNSTILDLRGIETLLKSGVDALTSAQYGIASTISSVSAEIDSKISLIQNKIRTVLSEIKIPTAELQKELLDAFNLLNYNVASFLSRINSLKTLFPSIDIDKYVKDILDGVITNFCSLIPNVQIIGGTEITKGIPAKLASTAISAISTASTIPNVLVSEAFKTLGVLTNGSKMLLDQAVSSKNLNILSAVQYGLLNGIETKFSKFFNVNPNTLVAQARDYTPVGVALAEEVIGRPRTLSSLLHNEWASIDRLLYLGREAILGNDSYPTGPITVESAGALASITMSDADYQTILNKGTAAIEKYIDVELKVNEYNVAYAKDSTRIPQSIKEGISSALTTVNDLYGTSIDVTYT